MARRSPMKEQSGISYSNAAVAATPKHLLQFAVDQRYDDYTPVDHAVWRFIMRQNIFFRRDYAFFKMKWGQEAAEVAGRGRRRDRYFGGLREDRWDEQDRRQETGDSHLEPLKCNSASSGSLLASVA